MFSPPQIIENSRQYLRLRTDILQKTVIGWLCMVLEEEIMHLTHARNLSGMSKMTIGITGLDDEFGSGLRD